jgi:hypothetical protein
MPLEQINEARAKYAAVLLPAGLNVSREQAKELAGLALELARLHQQEAVEYRKRAAFWRGYQPPVRRK